MKRKNTEAVLRREKELKNIEGRLQTALQPVNPRARYVEDLQLKLSGGMASVPASPEKHDWNLIWVAASLLSGTFLVVLLVRTVIALLNWLHLIGGRVESKSIAPIQQAA